MILSSELVTVRKISMTQRLAAIAHIPDLIAEGPDIRRYTFT